MSPAQKNKPQTRKQKSNIKTSKLTQTLIAALGVCLITLATPFPPTIASAEEAENPEQQEETKNTGVCPARPQSANLARAMLALTATQNCEDLPYTKADVEKYIEKLKCSPEAKAAIEQLSVPFAAQFQGLFKGPQVVSMCAQAKNFKALN